MGHEVLVRLSGDAADKEPLAMLCLPLSSTICSSRSLLKIKFIFI